MGVVLYDRTASPTRASVGIVIIDELNRAHTDFIVRLIEDDIYLRIEAVRQNNEFNFRVPHQSPDEVWCNEYVRICLDVRSVESFVAEMCT